MPAPDNNRQDFLTASSAALRWMPWPIKLAAALFVAGAAFVLYNQTALAHNIDVVAPDLRYELREHVPTTIGTWRGTLDNNLTVHEIALIQPDQYIRRHYIDTATGHGIHVFIPFSRRAQQLTSHEPNICYAGAGFVEVGSEERAVEYEHGGVSRTMPFNVVHFERGGRRQIVLWGYLLSTQRATRNTLMLRVESLMQQITQKKPASCIKFQIDLGEVEDTEEQLGATKGFLQQLLPYLHDCFPVDEIETVGDQEGA